MWEFLGEKVMNEIAVMFMVHDELKIKSIFQEVIKALKNQTIKVDIWVFGDNETLQEQWDMIPPEWQRNKTPKEIINNIPLKHKYVYDQLVQKGYQYIMINQCDDYSLPTRISDQLKIFEKYPDVGLCITGFQVYRDSKYEKDDCFKQKDMPCGFNVGYPSCWMFNTGIIPELPLVTGFECPFDYEWDVYMLLLLQQKYQIYLMEKPLVQYNFHSFSRSINSETEIITKRFEELCRFYQNIRPTLIPPYSDNYNPDSYFNQLSLSTDIPNKEMIVFGSESNSPVKNMNRKSIIIVGWMHKARQAGGLAQAFENNTEYRIIGISTDYKLSNKIYPSQYYICKNKENKLYQEQKKRFNLAEIVNPLIEDRKNNIQYMIIVQNTVFEYDVSGVKCPYYYIHHEMCYPQWPYSKDVFVKGLFWSFIGAFEQLWWLYRPEIEKTVFNTFLTYAVDSVVFPNQSSPSKRTYFIGFKGTLKYNCGQQPIWKNVYDNRDRILTFLMKYNETFTARWQKWKLNHIIKRNGKIKRLIKIEGREFNSEREHELYVDFCNDCQIGINISGNWGMVNERQFQVISMGCVLLQWDYPELAILGFYNRFNCLTFQDERSLIKQIKWAINHPRDLENIRTRGIDLVLNHHTYKQRVQKMLVFIEGQKKEYQETFIKPPKQLRGKLRFLYKRKVLNISIGSSFSQICDLFLLFKCKLVPTHDENTLTFLNRISTTFQSHKIIYVPDKFMREPEYHPFAILILDERLIHRIPPEWFEKYTEIYSFNLKEKYDQQRFLHYLEQIIQSKV